MSHVKIDLQSELQSIKHKIDQGIPLKDILRDHIENSTLGQQELSALRTIISTTYRIDGKELRHGKFDTMTSLTETEHPILRDQLRQVIEIFLAKPPPKQQVIVSTDPKTQLTFVYIYELKDPLVALRAVEFRGSYNALETFLKKLTGSCKMIADDNGRRFYETICLSGKNIITPASIVASAIGALRSTGEMHSPVSQDYLSRLIRDTTNLARQERIIQRQIERETERIWKDLLKNKDPVSALISLAKTRAEQVNNELRLASQTIRGDTSTRISNTIERSNAQTRNPLSNFNFSRDRSSSLTQINTTNQLFNATRSVSYTNSSNKTSSTPVKPVADSIERSDRNAPNMRFLSLWNALLNSAHELSALRAGPPVSAVTSEKNNRPLSIIPPLSAEIYRSREVRRSTIEDFLPHPTSTSIPMRKKSQSRQASRDNVPLTKGSRADKRSSLSVNTHSTSKTHNGSKNHSALIQSELIRIYRRRSVAGLATKLSGRDLQRLIKLARQTLRGHKYNRPLRQKPDGHVVKNRTAASIKARKSPHLVRTGRPLSRSQAHRTRQLLRRQAKRRSMAAASPAQARVRLLRRAAARHRLTNIRKLQRERRLKLSTNRSRAGMKKIQLRNLRAQTRIIIRRLRNSAIIRRATRYRRSSLRKLSTLESRRKRITTKRKISTWSIATKKIVRRIFILSPLRRRNGREHLRRLRIKRRLLVQRQKIHNLREFLSLMRRVQPKSPVLLRDVRLPKFNDDDSSDKPGQLLEVDQIPEVKI